MEEPSNPWSVVHFSIIRGGTLLSYNLQSQIKFLNFSYYFVYFVVKNSA